MKCGTSETRLRGGMRPTKPALALAAVALLALGGCKTIRHIAHDDSCNKPQPYMRATSVPPLNIPDGLDSPDTSRALDVPKLSEPAPPPRRPSDPCLDVPPPFDVPQANVPPGA